MKTNLASFRRFFAAVLLLALALAAFQAGCGSDGDGSTFTPGGTEPDGSIPPPPPVFGGTDGGNPDPSDADPDATLGVLDVSPTNVTINVVIANGVMNAPPQQFTATYNGAQVPATWLFDRGELGDIDANGVFKASGLVGEGTITARYGAREGTAKVKIVVTQTQNGAPTYAGGQPDGGVDGGGGFGGLGGVGGEPLGPPVDTATATKLRGTPTAPASAQELGFLYPYDGTVWPRGLLPPLLMWQTTLDANAVWVKLSQNGYTFEGTYALTNGNASSDQRKRVRLQDDAWRIATQGNTGDDLKVEVRIHTTAGNVIGPITRAWKVAPGVLRGVVYYNSYDSRITTNGGQQTGGVIAIKPRQPDPTLALPTQAGKCHVCHTVSADGSTIWVQDSKPGDNYEDGASYDLTQASTPRTNYFVSANAQNNRKFVWAGAYPNGSFALASSRFAREAYTQSDSKLFSRANGSEVASTGLDAVQSAVTPAFSPDGRKVVFNFWEGGGAGGVTAGAGHSLGVFDFTCGAAAGSVTCANGVTPAFSGLREIYKDANRWPAWPSFLPDGKAAIFHNTVTAPSCGPDVTDPNQRNSIHHCELTTWFGAKAELWIAKDGTTVDARALDRLNGKNIGAPTNNDHPDDSLLNYQPTVNPVASGGYYWVVFTSRRIYGNLLTAKQDSTDQKKLWVAAIDINGGAAGADPSHPAFYLPGQELNAGNSRGFWVVDPCKPNGTTCETGDECCNGFCRKAGDGGALVCQDKPPGTVCVQEFEKCTVDADCCDPKYKCIANKCSRPDPIIK